MYPNLNAELARKNKENADLQKLLSLSERTVRSRLTGDSDWKWTEVLRMRNEWFPTKSIDYLMADTEQQAG